MNVAAPIAQAPVEESVLEDLVELLWLEDVAGMRSRAVPSAAAKGCVEIALAAIRLRGRLEEDRWRGGDRLQDIRDTRTGLPVDAPNLLWHVLSTLPDLSLATIGRTMDQLRDSACNRSLFTDASLDLASKSCSEGGVNPLVWERFAALRDRPFHPLSHSRGGWSQPEIRRFGAEFGACFALRWCAVARQNVMASPAAGHRDPISALLDDHQADAIQGEMQRKGIAQTHVAIPMHPWQADAGLADTFPAELADGRIVLLDFQGPLAAATSSLRTLAILQRPGRHLKLPLDVETLGVRRLMSAQSLHNGLTGARLVSQALALRPGLGARAQIADETTFWTFSEPSRDVLAARTAFLGCAIRDFPAIGAGSVLVPLASLAVAPAGGLPPAIGRALEAWTGATVERFLRELFDLLLGFAVEALSCGFIPEMHGQNVLVELDEGRPRRLVLRDHDTVRCLPDQLRKAGLDVPDYIIKDPRRATMILTRDEDLCAYAQTLLIDVALRAVCVALDVSGRVDLHASRLLLKDATERALSLVEDRQDRLRALLLDAPEWPFKQILTPLLAVDTLGLGMPSAIGRASNPLRTDRAGT